MKRCLIVDDSEVIRKVARQILESMNLEIAEAENGQQALECCMNEAPDIVLLDWQLPVMGPIEFLSALRFSKSTRRPYILYATTENDPADLSRMYTAGIDDFILKPFDRKSLEAKFREIHAVA